MFNKRFIFYTVASAVIASLIVLLLPLVRNERTDRGYLLSQTKTDVKNINTALNQLEIACSVLPSGDNRAIFRTLFGSNTLQIVFLATARTNSDGELLDPWGSPYEIEILAQTNIVIKSAGKNGRWGDKDDYVFDGRKNEYLQDPSPELRP